jgi:Uncharacterised protein family (UPF0220)
LSEGESSKLRFVFVVLFQFFGAWWIVIGIAATAEKESAPDFSYYICGILGTISLIMVNTVSNEVSR